MKMFVAGPVNVTKSVKESMIYDEIGHREKEFEVLYKGIKDKLRCVFGARAYQYDNVIVGGSGTAAIETVLSSVLHDDKKTLVISNGAFGERMADICKLYDKSICLLSYEWGNKINLQHVEEFLKRQDIEAVVMVQMETSTGMLNPVHDVGELCEMHGLTYIIDAVSSLGGEELNMLDDHIDYCITNTNKCLGGVPVLGIICYDVNTAKRSRDIKPKTYSLDFFKHVNYSQKNQTPFTPHIPLFYMLNQSLDELLEEGVENRIKRYKNNGTILKQRLLDMGFEFQLNEGMSHLMVNAYVPKGFTYKILSEKLRQKGYVCYPYKADSKREIIHIANIGTLTEKDVNIFCDDMGGIIDEKHKS